MTNHPPKPERQSKRQYDTPYPTDHIDEAVDAHNKLLDECESHYESVITEYRDALRELVDAVADTKGLNILRTFEAMQDARQLLEGENNE